MPDSGFLELKLDYYAATNNRANGDFLRSDAFSAGGHTWRVKYYPCGWNDDDKQGEYLGLFFELVSKSENVSTVIFDAFLMGKDGNPSSSHSNRSMREYPPHGNSSFGWSMFVKRRDLESSCLVDGKVIIMCVVIILRENDLVGGMPMSVPPSDIGVHLGGLLDRGVWTDISFVDGETFHAHRVVLAARSLVFWADLFGSMAEAKMSSITKQEIEPVTFRALLHFIYTDELPQDGVEPELEGSLSPSTMTGIDLFQNLFVAAHKYNLNRLKLMCPQKLWEAISVDNAVATLVCAEKHGCPELKKRCLDFLVVKNNFKKAVLTEGYFQLMPRFPGVIDEIRAMLES